MTISQPKTHVAAVPLSVSKDKQDRRPASFRKLTIESAEEAVYLYFEPIRQIRDSLALVVKGPLVVKRLLDIAISMCFLLFQAPLFVVIALSIKATSPGPIFYVQERIGLNQRRFRMYKFRTMLPNLNKSDGGRLFQLEVDPRVTPIGRFLRRTSLDELPVLINVLKGDMSLVGPRPLTLDGYKAFCAKSIDRDRWYGRFDIRPGMASRWEWALLLDVYMDRWSVRLDLKIMARSFSALLRGA